MRVDQIRYLCRMERLWNLARPRPGTSFLDYLSRSTGPPLPSPIARLRDHVLLMLVSCSEPELQCNYNAERRPLPSSCGCLRTRFMATVRSSPPLDLFTNDPHVSSAFSSKSVRIYRHASRRFSVYSIDPFIPDFAAPTFNDYDSSSSLARVTKYGPAQPITGSSTA